MTVVCMMTYGLYAQDGTRSPYSFFGIGDLRAGRTVENQMMGGISILPDSLHVNLRNPAAYGNLILTAYTVGGSHEELGLETSSESQNTSVTNIDYLSIGLPLGKGLGIGFGVTPFSSVGYNLLTTSINDSGAMVTNAFGGEGGISSLYFSVGYKLLKNLNIGATTRFNFGTLEYERLQSVENVQFGTIDRRESRVNGLDFSFSALYTPKVSDKHRLIVSAIADTQSNLASENQAELGSLSLDDGADIEVINVNLDAQGLRNTDLKIPTTFSLGLGFGEDNKWYLGAEYSFQELGSFTNDFLAIGNITYEDATNLSVGGYFVPDFSSFSGYLKRITYRAGLRYTQTGMIINEEPIDDFGITFGFGFPLGDRASNFNLGFELGRRGTTEANLVRENYFQVNLSLSLNAKWFTKTKIN